MTMFLNVLNLLIKITWKQKTNNNTDENKQNENNNNKKNLKKKERERKRTWLIVIKNFDIYICGDQGPNLYTGP